MASLISGPADEVPARVARSSLGVPPVKHRSSGPATPRRAEMPSAHSGRRAIVSPLLSRAGGWRRARDHSRRPTVGAFGPTGNVLSETAKASVSEEFLQQMMTSHRLPRLGRQENLAAVNAQTPVSQRCVGCPHQHDTHCPAGSPIRVPHQTGTLRRSPRHCRARTRRQTIPAIVLGRQPRRRHRPGRGVAIIHPRQRRHPRTRRSLLRSGRAAAVTEPEVAAVYHSRDTLRSDGYRGLQPPTHPAPRR